MNTTPVITIFVRLSVGCKYAGDELAQRCDCRKWLRWSQNGIRHRIKADTRSWAEAEKVRRNVEDELSGNANPAADTNCVKNIREAVEVFLADKRVQGITEEVMGKYTRELGRLAAYCEDVGVYTVQGVTKELLTGFAGTWAKVYQSTQTRAAVKTRCSGFLRYCYEAQWIPRIPSLPKITVDEVPTLPLDADEYARLLDAADAFKGSATPPTSGRLFN